MRCLPAAVAASIEEAAAVVRGGGIVGFPTETVYGLCSLALDEAAVGALFAVKGRPATQPFTVMVGSAVEAAGLWREGPARMRALSLGERFWPGPLTVVAPRASDVPDLVTGGADTVGARVPDHPVALALLRAVGAPVCAPSANPTGEPPATDAEAVVSALGDRADVALVLDAGPSLLGVPSTVVDVSANVPRVLRPGAIDEAALVAALGQL
jgi:L-threonylcarbamoyladenylate synthase